MSTIHVCVKSIVLGIAARRRLIDGHDVCSGDFVNMLSKLNRFSSSNFFEKILVRIGIMLDP